MEDNFSLTFEEDYVLINVSDGKVEFRNKEHKEYEGKLVYEHKRYIPDEDEYNKLKELFKDGKTNFRVKTVIKNEG